MTQIWINPNELEAAARGMRLQADALRASERRLRQVLSGLDWAVRSRSTVDSQASAAAQDAVSLAERAELMGRFLEEVSRAFRELDEASAGRIGHSAGLLQKIHQGDRFDGQIPAPGTTEARMVWRPASPAVTSDASNRSAARYNDVINQFAVGNNPRYAVRDTDGRPGKETFCNFFVWDVSSAMGAPVPHWVQGDGVPYPDNLVAGAGGYGEVAGQAWEMNANAATQWLETYGEQYGWREVTAEEAQRMADQGCPAVAAWDSGSAEAGHMAMIRPSSADHPYTPANGPVIAQAGSTNINYSTVLSEFGEQRINRVVYYVHD